MWCVERDVMLVAKYIVGRARQGLNVFDPVGVGLIAEANQEIAEALIEGPGVPGLEVVDPVAGDARAIVARAILGSRLSTLRLRLEPLGVHNPENEFAGGRHPAPQATEK